MKAKMIVPAFCSRELTASLLTLPFSHPFGMIPYANGVSLRQALLLILTPCLCKFSPLGISHRRDITAANIAQEIYGGGERESILLKHHGQECQLLSSGMVLLSPSISRPEGRYDDYAEDRGVDFQKASGI